MNGMKHEISKTKRILTGILGLLILSFPLFSQTTPGTEIKNVAHAEYRDAGAFVYSVQSPPVITTVSPGSALMISKDAEKTVFLPLDTVVYHIRITNTGNIAASSVSVIDSLPAGLNYVSSQPPASVSANVISWNLLNLQAGATEDITLSAFVAPAVLPGTVLENIACYRSSDDRSGSSLPLQITIGTLPDLRLDKRVNRTSAEAGDTLQYTITLENLGNLATTQTRIYDNLPAGTELVSASGNAEYQSGILSWDLGVFAPGAKREESLTLVIADQTPAGTTLINYVSVSNSEGITRNASASTLIAETPMLPELWIEKSSVSTASPDDTLVYRMIFGNRGNGNATGVQIRDSLDAQLLFLDASGSYLYDAEKHQISWNRSDLGPGERDSLQLRAKIHRGSLDGSVIRNSVQIGCSESVKAEAYFDLTVLSPNLFLNKSTTETTVDAGSELEYLIEYRNSGNGVARNVTIRDTLSAELEFVSADGSVSYEALNRVVHWNIGSLPANMAATETQLLRVRVQSPLPNGTLIDNTAHIESREGFSAVASAHVTVESAAQLSLIKSAPASAFPGDTLQYQIRFTNNGNAIARQSIIRDTLAAELELIRADAGYSFDPLHNSLSWNIGDLNTGTDSILTLEVRVATDLSGVHLIGNTAVMHTQETLLRSNTVQTTVRSLNLQISADPDSILGNGESYSSIHADLKDASGQPAPDGTRIVFRSSAGSFPSGTDTIPTLNGIAETRLYSKRIDREFLPVQVYAEVLQNNRIGDSTHVVFYSNRLIGFVENSENEPVNGATVTVLQGDQVIGADTTGTDGYYSIPIFVSGTYTIIITYVDQFGITRTIEQEVEIIIDGSGQSRIVLDKCTISGNIVDQGRQEPIREAGIPVIIRRISDTGMAKRSLEDLRDTTLTDSSGFWAFRDLETGIYSIETNYTGSGYYHAGVRQIVLDAPGQYLINADLVLRPVTLQAYKKVDKAQAIPGDTLNYRIYYQSLEYPFSDTIRITDILPEQVEWIPASLQHSADVQLLAFDGIRNELRFRRIGMPAEERDSIAFAVRVLNDLGTATTSITNRAKLFYGIDSVNTADDTRSTASTQIVSPFLFVKKNVNRRVAENGDILSYVLNVENRSSEHPLYDLQIRDILPPGFRYRENRSIGNGQSIDDPAVSFSASRQMLVWSLPDTLAPGQSYELKYRIYVGLDSRFGENTNIASATAKMAGGFLLTSPTAAAEVILKPGLLHERGFIFGKVFYDLNGNHMHDQDEPAVKGVEIITEEGIRVITDEYGKYSIPNIRSGDHVLRINRNTLPENAGLKLYASDFLGDASSRLVKVRPSGIAKANFILEGPDVSPLSRAEKASDVFIRETPAMTTALLSADQQARNEPLRLIAYQPWIITLHLDFSAGGAIPTPADECIIDRIVDFLKWQDHLQIRIKGHTDNTPVRLSPYRDNLALSQARAETVMNYLREQGIAAERMKAEAYGDSEPLMSNNTAAGRDANRRVELVFLMDKATREYESGLSIRTLLRYEGTMPLQQVRFISRLPEGFRSSAFPENKDSVILDLGNWNVSLERQLDLHFVPSDPMKIRKTSTLISYLEYQESGGIREKTPELQLRIPTRVEESLFNIVLKGANFRTGSANLPVEAIPELKKLGEFLSWQEKIHILVEGFTDSIGSESMNRELSARRAEAVKRYLVSHYAIAEERIKTVGYGEDYPVADNGSAEGRARNRRVEIIIESERIQQNGSAEIIRADSFQLQIKAHEAKSLKNKRKNKP